MVRVKDFIQGLDLAPGNSYRGDCPVCSGKNTFSARNEMGRIFYNCFRASCDCVGNTKAEMSAKQIEETICKLPNLYSSFLQGTKGFNIPDHWTLAHHYQPAHNYLIANGCIDAYVHNRVSLRYDPKLDRVVFIIRDEYNTCFGAVGRKLGKGEGPKWYNYHKDCTYPFVARCDFSNSFTNPVWAACVVEDAASACAVSQTMDGVALLGTDLNENYIKVLSEYDSVIVALDKDASAKALDIQKHLNFYVKHVDVLLLKRDLKYESKERIRELLLC